MVRVSLAVVKVSVLPEAFLLPGRADCRAPWVSGWVMLKEKSPFLEADYFLKLRVFSKAVMEICVSIGLDPCLLG